MSRAFAGAALVVALAAGGCTADVTGTVAPESAPPPEAGDVPAGGLTACDPANLLEPRLLRLAASELRQHVRGALPQVAPGLIDALDLQADHLAGVAERAISGAEFGSYRDAVGAVARSYAMSSGEALPCSQAGAEETCLQSVLKPAVGRLYRAPPTPEEWAGFEAAYRKLLPTHGGVQAAAAVIASALLSPRTLYQTERGDGPIATGSFTLSKLEALTLARFALTGQAANASEVAAVAGLDQPAFRASLGQLAAGWVHTPEFATRALDFVQARFGLEHLAEVNRLDPAFTDGVKLAMASEFREHVTQTLLSASGSFEQLFTSDRAEIFPGLEAIYGGGDPALSGSARRRGVLGLASLLAARASPAGSDPVKRGIMVRVELLCEAMPPPVPDADFGKVMVTEDMQTRERFESLASIPACQACHTVINPPGYLFEEFDELGRYRTMEKGRPVNAVGTIPAFFGEEPYAGVESWDGIVPLANWLARSSEARLCFATHFASYVLAQTVPAGTKNCALPLVTSRFMLSGRLDELAHDLVQSELFLQRRRGTP